MAGLAKHRETACATFAWALLLFLLAPAATSIGIDDFNPGGAELDLTNKPGHFQHFSRGQFALCNGSTRLCLLKLNEIAFPMSYAPLDGTADIAEQLKRGIRAFVFEIQMNTAKQPNLEVGDGLVCGTKPRVLEPMNTGLGSRFCVPAKQVFMNVTSFLANQPSELIMLLIIDKTGGRFIGEIESTAAVSTGGVELVSAELVPIKVNDMCTRDYRSCYTEGGATPSFAALSEYITTNQRLMVIAQRDDSTLGKFSPEAFLGRMNQPGGMQGYPPAKKVHSWPMIVKDLYVQDTPYFASFGDMRNKYEETPNWETGKLHLLRHEISLPFWWRLKEGQSHGSIAAMSNFDLLRQRMLWLMKQGTPNLVGVRWAEISIVAQVLPRSTQPPWPSVPVRKEQVCDEINSESPRPYTCYSAHTPTFCCGTANPAAGNCSGKGTCNIYTGQCTCADGFGGPECSLRGGSSMESCFLVDSDCPSEKRCNMQEGRGNSLEGGADEGEHQWLTGFGDCEQDVEPGGSCWADGECYSRGCDTGFKCGELLALSEPCPPKKEGVPQVPICCPLEAPPKTPTGCADWCQQLTMTEGTVFESHFTRFRKDTCCECISAGLTYCHNGKCLTGEDGPPEGQYCCQLRAGEAVSPVAWIIPLAFVIVLVPLGACLKISNIQKNKQCMMIGGLIMMIFGIAVLSLAAWLMNAGPDTFEDIADQLEVDNKEQVSDVPLRMRPYLGFLIFIALLLMIAAVAGVIGAKKEAKPMLLAFSGGCVLVTILLICLAMGLIFFAVAIQDEQFQMQAKDLYVQLPPLVQREYTFDELADMTTQNFFIVGIVSLFPVWVNIILLGCALQTIMRIKTFDRLGVYDKKDLEEGKTEEEAEQEFAEAKEQVAEEDKAIEEAVAKKPFKEKMLMKMTGLPIIGKIAEKQLIAIEAAQMAAEEADAELAAPGKDEVDDIARSRGDGASDWEDDLDASAAAAAGGGAAAGSKLKKRSSSRRKKDKYRPDEDDADAGEEEEETKKKKSRQSRRDEDEREGAADEKKKRRPRKKTREEEVDDGETDEPKRDRRSKSRSKKGRESVDEAEVEEPAPKPRKKKGRSAKVEPEDAE